MKTFTTAKHLLNRRAKWRLGRLIPFNTAKVLLYGVDANRLAYWILAHYLKSFKRGILIALGDYHNGHLFDLNLLAEYLFAINSDPLELFENLLTGAAYNLEQFSELIDKLANVEPSLLFLTGLDRLTKNWFLSPLLNSLVWKLTNIWVGPILLTCEANKKSKAHPPNPNVTHYIRHIMDVIAYVNWSDGKSFSIYLMKHPFEPYSKITIITGDTIGEKHSIY